jgi:hypothetical protein
MKARLILSVILAVALAPQIAHAQGADRLAIHGYLTQGFAISDGGSVFGITESGTNDYRNAALQFRYALSGEDNVTVQFSHRSQAQSTLQPPNEDAIEVDWAFYGRRLGDLEVKLGRIAIPAGIYNETRDVGVLLPFYRAPINFYLEGAYTSETVDGVVASYSVNAGSSWSADISAFGGEWDISDREPTAEGYVSKNERATGGLGGSIWINTPIDGVRFGGGASRYEAPVANVGGLWKEWHGSLDISLPQVTVQSEIRKFVFENGDYLAYYGYVGVRPISRLTLHAMADFTNLSLDLGGGMVMSWDYHDEYVLGASFAVSPSVVFKLEGHRTDGYWVDEPMIDPSMAPTMPVDFLIFSVSTAF